MTEPLKRKINELMRYQGMLQIYLKFDHIFEMPFKLKRFLIDNQLKEFVQLYSENSQTLKNVKKNFVFKNVYEQIMSLIKQGQEIITYELNKNVQRSCLNTKSMNLINDQIGMILNLNVDDNQAICAVFEHLCLNQIKWIQREFQQNIFEETYFDSQINQIIENLDADDGDLLIQFKQNQNIQQIDNFYNLKQLDQFSHQFIDQYYSFKKICQKFVAFEYEKHINNSENIMEVDFLERQYTLEQRQLKIFSTIFENFKNLINKIVQSQQQQRTKLKDFHRICRCLNLFNDLLIKEDIRLEVIFDIKSQILKQYLILIQQMFENEVSKNLDVKVIHTKIVSFNDYQHQKFVQDFLNHLESVFHDLSKLCIIENFDQQLSQLFETTFSKIVDDFILNLNHQYDNEENTLILIQNLNILSESLLQNTIFNILENFKLSMEFDLNLYCDNLIQKTTKFIDKHQNDLKIKYLKRKMQPIIEILISNFTDSEQKTNYLYYNQQFYSQKQQAPTCLEIRQFIFDILNYLVLTLADLELNLKEMAEIFMKNIILQISDQIIKILNSQETIIKEQKIIKQVKSLILEKYQGQKKYYKYQSLRPFIFNKIQYNLKWWIDIEFYHMIVQRFQTKQSENNCNIIINILKKLSNKINESIFSEQEKLEVRKLIIKTKYKFNINYKSLIKK